MTDRQTDAPKRRRLPAILAAAGFVAVLGLALAGAVGGLQLLPAAPPAPVAVAAAPAPAPAPIPAALPKPLQKLTAITIRLARNQTLAQALVKLELPMAKVNAIVGSLKGLFPFNHSRPGDQLRLERHDDTGEVHRFSYRQGPADE